MFPLTDCYRRVFYRNSLFNFHETIPHYQGKLKGKWVKVNVNVTGQGCGQATSRGSNNVGPGIEGLHVIQWKMKDMHSDGRMQQKRRTWH